MRGKQAIKTLGIAVAGTLADKAPAIIDRIVKKKEEKTFFEDNKSWIYLIILSIFITKLDYINMFKNVIFNSVINMIFGIIVLVLLFIFGKEETKSFKDNTLFIKALIISSIILGIINSLYHIGYAIYLLF